MSATLRMGVLSAALLCACMTAPENETSLPSTSAEQTFRGFWIAPLQTVSLQVATSADGPFTTFATARSDKRSVALDGVRLFPWSVRAVVPTWGGSGCDREAFVRARAGSIDLYTFDRAAGGSPSGMGCLQDALDAGASLPSALLACISDQSPVVRLTAGGGTFTGDVVVTTQAEADALACYTVIDGSLTIGDDPTALAIALPNLERVTGDVTIVYSRGAGGSPTPMVRTVALPALAEIGGDLALSYPGSVSDLITLDLGLEALTSTGGDVAIALTTFNANLSGLDALASIPGDLVIESSGSDLSLFGLLPALTHVAADVRLRNGLTLVGTLPALATIGGSLQVEESFFNPGTTNFASLTAVGGDVELLTLAGLITFAGSDHQFDALASVGGELAIVGANGFAVFAFGDPTGLAVGGLRLDENGSLTSVVAPHVTVAPAGPIAITDNPNLCQTDAQAFVAAQASAGWMGVATISGNATCP